eukprot:2879774-Lingulodinium_polyedra.AAC.1
MEVAKDKEKGSTDAGNDDKGCQGLPPASTEVPPCPALALHGRIMIRSTLTAWWKRWAGRTTERCAINEELRR